MAKRDDDTAGWVRKLKSSFGSSARFPSGLRIVDLGSSNVELILSAKAQTGNMQADEGAFEAWTLALLHAGANSVTLQWTPVTWKKLAPGAKDEEQTQRNHWNRFCFRVHRFTELFDSKCRMGNEVAATTPDPLKVRKGTRLLLNVEGKRNRAGSSAEKVPRLHDQEKHLEAWLMQNRSVVEWQLGLRSLGRQLPAGVFAGSVTSPNKIFSGGKSAIDLWGIGEYANGEAKSRLKLIELKRRGNEKAGAVSELFFYSMLMREVQAKAVAFAESENSTFGLGGQSSAGYRKIAETRGVDAILLAPQFHPIIDDGNRSLFALLNDALEAKGYDIRFCALELDQEEGRPVFKQLKSTETSKKKEVILLRDSPREWVDVKTIFSAGHDSHPGRVLATFSMHGDRLHAEYKNSIVRSDFEADGLFIWDRTLFPSNGRAFFDALEKGLSNSSSVAVFRSQVPSGSAGISRQPPKK